MRNRFATGEEASGMCVCVCDAMDAPGQTRLRDTRIELDSIVEASQRGEKRCRKSKPVKFERNGGKQWYCGLVLSSGMGKKKRAT